MKYQQIKQFCIDYGYTFRNDITYKSHGYKIKRKGIDILDSNGRILVAFEPVTFNYFPDKWVIYLRNIPNTNNIDIRVTRITYNYLKELFNV